MRERAVFDLLGLPLDALEHTVSFLGQKDQVMLTLMNQKMLVAVEQACDKELKQIIQKHAVDTTFHARIRDQERIDTTRAKPVHLPWRYLLWAAKRTYLYKIELTEDEEGRDDYSIKLSPSGNRLAMTIDDLQSSDEIVLLDLSTKRRSSLSHPNLNYSGMLWIDDNTFLTETSLENTTRIVLWNETANGVWNHKMVLNLRNKIGLVQTNDEVLLVELLCDRGRCVSLLVHSINTHDGSVSRKWTFDTGNYGFYSSWISPVIPKGKPQVNCPASRSFKPWIR